MRSISRFGPSFTSGAARYLLAILSVATALGVRLLLQRLGVVGASEMRMTLFLYAIAVSAWYLGAGPGLVAAIVSTLTYNYFLKDSHSLRIAPDQIPFYVAFVLFAVVITRFTAVRRRVERELLHLRDGLQKEVLRSESYLLEAQRLSRTGSFGWNPASGTIYWSEETYRIFGVEPGTPPTLELVVQRTHPDDRAAVQATIGCAQRDGLDFEHQYRLLMPNGSVKHLHVVAHAVTDDGDRREFVGAVMDVTERESATSALAAERARLAGEIHDTLAQGLAMTVMQLADAEAKLGPAWVLAEKPLGLVRELAVESLAYARRSVTMLHPSAPAAGLAQAIREVVDRGRRHFGGTLNFAVTGDALLLPASVESALAGIAREALTNATRHSGAPRVEVELAFQDGGAVRLAVADDGVGFDVENVRSNGYGLTSMQDRAARAGVALTFVTEAGAGTEVVASWSP